MPLRTLRPKEVDVIVFLHTVVFWHTNLLWLQRPRKVLSRHFWFFWLHVLSNELDLKKHNLSTDIDLEKLAVLVRIEWETISKYFFYLILLIWRAELDCTSVGLVKFVTVLSNWKIDGSHKIFGLFRSKAL